MIEGILWVDANRDVYPFVDDGLYLEWGMANLHGTGHRIARRAVAGQPGTVLDLVEDDVRAFAIPAMLEVSASVDFRQAVEEWAYRLDPTRGDGAIFFNGFTGVSRYIVCRCVGGFRFAETPEVRPGLSTLRTVLEFEADDPYWRDYLPSSSTWTAGSGAPTWFPLLPLTLSADNVLGDTLIVVPSSKPVFPKWTITGPGTTVTLEHSDTGRELVWDGTLANNTEVLTIDARPDSERGLDAAPGAVLDPPVTMNGTNAFADLTSWDLFPLVPGQNNLSVTVTGATADTVVLLEWRNAYNGPR